MLTERQKEVLDFIQSEQREKGITPSTREIQNHFGFASQTSVMQYLGVLQRKGVLDRHARKARALITPIQKVRITESMETLLFWKTAKMCRAETLWRH